MRNFRLLLALMLLLAAAACGGGSRKPVAALPPQVEQSLVEYEAATSNLTPEQQYISQLLSKKGYNGHGPKPTVIVVHKRNRTLTVYQGLTPLKTFPVVLGNNPRNDKLCQGDACTPEGVYRVRAKYPHPRWDQFIWLDYPNTQNWLKFAQAKKSGRLPPDADIGGEVGIHGTEDPLRNLSGVNWTKGCISLLNKDLDEIAPLVNEQTLVVINKE